MWLLVSGHLKSKECKEDKWLLGPIFKFLKNFYVDLKPVIEPSSATACF